MHGRARPLVADGDDPGWTGRCRSGSASPTWAPDNVEHTPDRRSTARCSARSSASSGSSIEHYGGAFPFWLAPVQVRLIPVGEDHRDAVARAARAPRRGGLPRRRRRARRDDRQADPRRRAREDPVHDRLRRPRGRRGTSVALVRVAAVRERGGEQSTMGLEELLERFRARACYDRSLKEERTTAPHLPEPIETGVREGSTEPVGRGKVAAACSGFSSSMRRIPRAW